MPLKRSYRVVADSQRYIKILIKSETVWLSQLVNDPVTQPERAIGAYSTQVERRCTRKRLLPLCLSGCCFSSKLFSPRFRTCLLWIVPVTCRQQYTIILWFLLLKTLSRDWMKETAIKVFRLQRKTLLLFFGFCFPIIKIFRFQRKTLLLFY